MGVKMINAAKADDQRDVVALSKGNRSLLAQMTTMREFGILIALIIMCVCLAAFTDGFLRLNNLINVTRQVSLLGIVSMGMTFVIISGEIDLSLGRVYSLSGMVCGFGMTHGLGVWPSMGMGLLCGLAIGLFNGLVSTYGRIPSFITTLGTMNIATGLALILTNGLSIHLTTYDVLDKALPLFFFLGGGRLFGLVPMQVVLYAVISVLSGILLHRTVIGVRFYAVGGSKTAAKAVGINVAATKTIAFTILGGLSAVAGILSLSFIRTIQASAGANILFDAFSAVIIGGTSMSGGVGTIWGTVIGTMLIGVLRNGLVILGVSAFWQVFIVGVVILIAVGVDKWMTRGLRGAGA